MWEKVEEVLSMEILDMPVSEIVPYENNPRNNEAAVEKVMKSIQEFGFKVPIVVDSDHIVLAGHTRLLAAKELGMKTVPVIVAADLDEARAKAFRLADNKVSEFSSWDFDKLDEELAGLACLDVLDMSEFGFADTPDINWDDTPDLNSDNYEEPEKAKLQCPNCGHVAGKDFFKKV